MTDTRITEVEIRTAHIEKLLAELSDVVYQQQRELDSLRKEVDRLQDKVNAEPGLVDANRHDRPPHY